MIGGTASAATWLLDGLESKGTVERVHGLDDRRQALPTSTPNGRGLADRLPAAFEHRWRGLCVGIPPAELEAGSMALEQMVARLDRSTIVHAPSTRARAHRRQGS